MGQRSQQFIRVLNPLYILKQDIKQPKDRKKFMSTSEYKKWVKTLGGQKYTVLAYHHQWLYGMTFAAIMHQILSFYRKTADGFGENHPLNYPDYFIRLTGGIQQYIDIHTNLASLYTRPWEYTRQKGYERFYFLNTENPEMRRFFDRGDNNDGICIMDAISGKYAFMSIDHTEGRAKLPIYEPLSAVEYVESYYPTSNDYEPRYPDDKKIFTDEELAENKRRITFVRRKYKHFTVLTKEEIAKMFPNMKTVLFSTQQQEVAQEPEPTSVVDHKVTPAHFLTQNNII